MSLFATRLFHASSRTTWPTSRAIRSQFFSTTKSSKDVRYVRFSDPPAQRPKPLGPRAKLLLAGVGLGAVYYATHLEQVPQTGRWRFMNTSSKTEAEIGELSRQEIYREMGDRILPINHPVTRHVRRVVFRVLSASKLGTLRGESPPTDYLLGYDLGLSTLDTDFGASAEPGEAYGPQKEWDVIVVNDKKTINAMAAPGVVTVFTGILPVCQDEEGLASVLAHEIGHVVARHTAERISSQVVMIAFIFILQAFNIDYFISNSITTYILELPNSRTQEREADLIGLRLMARACYDPGAAPAMFERLGKLETSIIARKSFEFARTHPSSENRVKYLEQALPEAYDIVAVNPECGQIKKQLEAFRETAHEIKIDDHGVVQVL